MRKLMIAVSSALAFACLLSMNVPASAQGIYQGGSYEPGLVPTHIRNSLGPWGVQRNFGNERFGRHSGGGRAWWHSESIRWWHSVTPVQSSAICCERPAPPPGKCCEVPKRRPVHYHRPVVHAPVRHAVVHHAPPKAECPPAGCAVDLHATYIDCVVRDGHQLWRYRTARGIVSMTVQRRNEADMVRFEPNGQIVWVAVN